MIDKIKVHKYFRRSVPTYGENAGVQREIARHLTEMMRSMGLTSFSDALEIGCGTGILTFLLKHFVSGDIFINDMVKEMCDKCGEDCGIPERNRIYGDIETLHIIREFDAVFSASVFQWLEDIGKTVETIACRLRGNGVLAFSTFGPDNMKELRKITGRGLIYKSSAELKEILSSRFEILTAEEGFSTVYFDTPVAVMRHVLMTGAGGVDGDAGFRLKDFCTDYIHRFGTPRGLPLTYHPLYFVCRKR